MTIQQANNIPIVEILAREGFMPKKQVGRSWWYISPIRAPEDTASFKVDTVINKWYDHGIGEGGGSLDLALLLYRLNSIQEALDLLSNHSGSSMNRIRANQNFPVRSMAGKHPDRKIIITNVTPLSKNLSLISYLQSRAIPFKVADFYCKAVDYELRLEGELSGKKYFAVGFQNRSGGYELRNPLFKGSSSPKDITHLTRGSGNVSVFEGFIDFLSALVAKEELPVRGDYLILNSMSLLEKNLPLISQYKEIISFLDNDSAGKQGLSKLQQAGLNVVDATCLYAGSKDVNDWLLSHKKENQRKFPKRSQGI